MLSHRLSDVDRTLFERLKFVNICLKFLYGLLLRNEE
jgi:hypothetical protein